MSLLPGCASEAEASLWQPSSAHSPASAASTTLTPVPWQATYHKAAALAQVGPAALQTSFQQVMHRSGSLQVEAAKEVKVLQGHVLLSFDCILFQDTYLPLIELVERACSEQTTLRYIRKLECMSSVDLVNLCYAQAGGAF